MNNRIKQEKANDLGDKELIKLADSLTDRDRMALADGLSDKQLIELVENRGHKVVKATDILWKRCFIKINGKSIYKYGDLKDDFAVEDRGYLREPTETELAKIKEKLGGIE